MRQIKSNLILTALSFFAGCSFAQSIPWGTWTTVDEHTGAATSIVKVVETENGLMGTIDRILDPAKADARCTACTDERKDQPIAGMVIFRDVKIKEDQALTWDGGQILDPKSGNTYRVRIRLLDDGKTLEVRGYKGTPFLGRTQLWKRLTDDASANGSPTPSSAPASTNSARP